MQFAYDYVNWKQVFVISLYYILAALPALSLFFQQKNRKKIIKKQIIMHEKNLLSDLRIANDSDRPSKDK